MERQEPISASTQDYAKAIYALSERGDGTVGTNALAERLGVTAGSVSAMLKKLAVAGLVRHEPYRGVALTERGRRVALETLRHHRLLELFLAKELGMPWDKVHAEAEVLEHVISEDLEQLIAEKLGDPHADPHGDPIPSAELALDDRCDVALDTLEAGQAATFVRVSDSDPAMLRFLDARGVRPGDRLVVLDRQPFGGPLTLEVEGVEHVLGGALVGAMRVELADG